PAGNHSGRSRSGHGMTSDARRGYRGISNLYQAAVLARPMISSHPQIRLKSNGWMRVLLEVFQNECSRQCVGPGLVGTGALDDPGFGHVLWRYDPRQKVFLNKMSRLLLLGL